MTIPNTRSLGPGSYQSSFFFRMDLRVKKTLAKSSAPIGLDGPKGFRHKPENWFCHLENGGFSMVFNREDSIFKGKMVIFLMGC